MKSCLKITARCAAGVMVLPAVMLYWLAAGLGGRDRAFAGWSQAFALLPGTAGAYLRSAFYRRVLRRCAADAFLSFGTVISHSTARIGSRVYTGAYCVLGDVTLEEDVLLASHVSVINGSGQHGTERLDVPIREQAGRFVPVTIGAGSWIGERAVVAADVGRHCIIGAGAVVTKPIPDYAVTVGVPARVIRFRNTAASRDEPAEPAPRREPEESLT